MTGFGEDRRRNERHSLAIEVRSVNNRGLKLTVRGTDPYPMLEADLEKIIRRHVKRGTILLHVRVERLAANPEYGVNIGALKSYIQQVESLCNELKRPDYTASILSRALALPGVASEPALSGRPDESEWKLVEAGLNAAMSGLNTMRRDEGRAMGEELLQQRRHVANQLDLIEQRLPDIVEGYRKRIHERVTNILKDMSVGVSEEHLLRETAIFAERADISEELTRLKSHLDQFSKIVNEEEDSPGRKLEFLTQEMFRETNTIGSKANDVAVSRNVVEIKASLEKVRELVQNVE